MQHRDRQDKMRKTALGSLLVVFLVTGGLSIVSLVAAPPAQAQAIVHDPGVDALMVPTFMTAQSETKASVWDAIKITLANTAALALLNASQYFVTKIAYDTANYIASGGHGQKPLFITEGFGKYLENTGLDAAGEALGTITQVGGLEKLGINLCSPTDPRIALNIKLGFLANIGRFAGGQPRPKCAWNQVSANWDQFTSQTSDQVLKQVGVMFSDSGQTPLGAALEFNRYSLNLISAKQQAAANNFVTNQGFKAVVNTVSGEVKTPASVVQDQMRQSQTMAANQTLQNTQITGDAFKAGAYGVLGAAVKTFTNTLAQKLTQRLFNKGLISISSIVPCVNLLGKGLGNLGTACSSGNQLTNPDAVNTGGGQTAAQLSNTDLLTPKVYSTTNYDALLDFTSCPDGFKSPYNCAMDGQFFSAVNRAAANQPLTVQQAVSQGLVNGGWRLLPISSPKNIDRNCYLSAFCYSNLTKLRAARVIPIGWELAANSPFNDLNNPVTLQEAMDHFNDCTFITDANGNKIVDPTKLPDPLHPWCRLIDPNWVLKYPKSICQQQGSGPQLLDSQSNARAQLCVDPTSCIQEDSNGNCVAGYGYCVQERSAWKIDADACEAQFASCQALKRDDGQNFSYMLNTITAGTCNADNAGCTARSTVKNAVPNGGFEDVIAGAPRDWTVVGGGVEAPSQNAFLGDAAGYVTGGSLKATGDVLPGKPYKLGLSARLGGNGANAKAVASVSFLDQDGLPVTKACISAKTNGVPKTCTVNADCGPSDACVAVQISQDCQAAVALGSVSFSVPATDLGYQTGSCNVTAPANAYKAVVTITGQGGGGSRLYVDEVGLYGDSYSSSLFDAAFLNGKAAACDSGKVGCTQLVRENGAALNMVVNSGFEARSPDGTLPIGWSNLLDANYLADQQKGYEGAAAITVPGPGTSQDVSSILPSAPYAFSVFSTGAAGNVTVVGLDSNGAAISTNGVQNLCQATANGAAASMPLPGGATYQRTTCIFNAPPNTAKLRIVFNSGGATIDAVQLELGGVATDYHEGYAAKAERVSMKVAPTGISCTGGPTDPAACKDFTKSCRREDVGCSLYSPDDGSTVVPAVTSPSDACPAECAGYAAFREEPTAFTDAAFPVTFVPSTATACTAKEAGCQEFTNLEKLSQGGEAREYFTSMRLCQKPDNQAVSYYTWEGNDLKGFQLRVWALRQSNMSSGAGATDPTGGIAPCTNLGYDAANNPVCKDTAATSATCTKDSMPFNPDCREFFDAAGNIHYRLYSRTVLASDQCVEYRQTSATQASCTTHGGLWINNECHYFSYGPENVSCQASANNCRAYTGNASRNLRIVVSNDFEDGTSGAWVPAGAVSPSTEAVSASGHSLKITAGQITEPLAVNGATLITQGKSYLVTFWAKGTGDITPTIVPGAVGAPLVFPPAGLSTDWQAYTVGPVQLTTLPDLTAKLQLGFSPAASAGRPAFIDNFQLREITDSIYDVKDSWKTPASCDQDPNGNASPQYMLGCKAYKNQAGNQVYLKSFARLCREEAVGCTAFYDTHNTDSPGPETWNASCLLGSACTPGAGITSCPCQANNQTVCTVPTGQFSCYYNTKDEVAPANISPFGDTVRIKADTLKYLIDDKQFYCDVADAGCTETAKPIRDGEGKTVQSWQTVYLKNQPSTYATTLCTQQENACQAYTKAEDGTQVYFKDPAARTCDYRTGVTINGQKTSGWFRTGTDNPCDPGFLIAGTQYGLSKNSDSGYDGWVGNCPSAQSQCKEFRDTSDVSVDFPQGRPYFYIKNDRIDTASCAGQISRTTSPSGATDASACAMFQQADDVSRLYDTTTSYTISEKQFGALVPPVDETTTMHLTGNAIVGGAAGQCGNGVIDKVQGEECDLGLVKNGNALGCSSTCLSENDANIIIRATRDRQCAAWLDCRSSETVFNPSTGAFTNVCSSFGLCTEYMKVGDSTKCVKYADSSYANKVLDNTTYASRPTGWGSLEYSGDAVPYRYPIDELKTVDLAGKTGQPDPRLVYASGSCSGANFTTGSCGTNNIGNPGTCVNGTCIWPIDGGPGITSGSGASLQQNSAKIAFPAASCRLYPREDSPFPGTVADPGGWDYSVTQINDNNPRLLGSSPAFKGANVCQRRVLNFSHCSNNPSLSCDSNAAAAPAAVGGGAAQQLPSPHGGNASQVTTVAPGTSIAVQCGSASATCDTDAITYDSCECGYIQTKYSGDITKYFPLNGPDIPNGYCEQGTYKDLECDPAARGLRAANNLSCCSKLGTPDPDTGVADCQDDGGCQVISKTDYLVGEQGQCIERDFSTPINGTSDQYACANWRPTGLVGGSLDIYNLNRTAGYFAPIDRQFYCAETEPSFDITYGVTKMTVGQNLILGIASKDGGNKFTFRFCNNTGVGTSHAAPLDCVDNSNCEDIPNDNGNGTTNGSCQPYGVCADAAGNHSGSTCAPIGPGNCAAIDPAHPNCVQPFTPGEMSDQGPLFQHADHFFGPGKVTSMVPNTSSGGQDCEDADNARWCVFPGISTTCEPQAAGTPPTAFCGNGVCETGEGVPPGAPAGSAPSCSADCFGGKVEQTPSSSAGNSCPRGGIYALRQPISNGIVGCYEVADGSETDAGWPTIDWPYIGPTIYRDQLAGITFHFVDNLYENTATGNGGTDATPDPVTDMSPTNPHQFVTRDCNDEGGDSIIDITAAGRQAYCTLQNQNGWQKECVSNGSGKITSQAVFGNDGELISLKLTARDYNDEGTFGIKDLILSFNPACATVARVSDPGSLGLTKADTELVNNYRMFGNGTPVSPSTTNLTQACRPWGAIGSQTQNPPSDASNLLNSTRWTSVSVIPMARDAQGNIIAPAKEKVINQCTDISYRQGSGYTNSSFTPDPVGKFLRSLFRRITQAWNFFPLSLPNSAIPAGQTQPGAVDLQGGLVGQQYKSAIPLNGAPSGSYFDYTRGNPPPHGPTIASVNTAKCGSDGVCPARNANAVSINGNDAGILLGQNGVYAATMQFYAWASNDSMPIVSRTVAWGDTSVNEPPATGWYKNHKPYCSPDESDKSAASECQGTPGLTCRSAGDCGPSSACTPAAAHFGSTPGACDASPFKFNHTYTCTAGDIKAIPVCVFNANGRATNTPCRDKARVVPGIWSCIYQPRVQVVDNWGWCSCTGSGCTIPSGLYDNGTACDMSKPPVGGHQPWVAFSGEIRVTASPADSAASGL